MIKYITPKGVPDPGWFVSLKYYHPFGILPQQNHCF